MFLIVLLISVMITVRCNDTTTECEPCYVILTDQYLASCFQKTYKQTLKKIIKPDCDSIQVKPNLPIFGCGDSMFIDEKWWAPASFLGDMIYSVVDYKQNMTLYFKSTSECPVAIVIDAGTALKEVMVGGNVLLRKRMTKEIELNGIRTKCYYVPEEVANLLLLQKTQVIFVEDKCHIAIYNRLQRYNKIIENFTYDSTAIAFPARVVLYKE